MELLLRFSPGGGGIYDLCATIAEGAIVADLGEALASMTGVRAGLPLPVVRNRAATPLSPGARVVDSDVRSGDEIELTWLTRHLTGDTQPPVAVLTFQSGPDAGRTHPLHLGSNTLGRDPDADVVISDPLVSRHHLDITVTDKLRVADLGSVNSSSVNGTQLTAPRYLGEDDQVAVGGSSFRIGWLTAPGAFRGVPGQILFNRPPRLLPPYPARVVEIPEPPSDPPRQRLPMISALIPAVMAVGMWFLTKSLFSIVFLAFSPLMMLGSYWENKRGARADHREQLADWRSQLQALRQQLTGDREEEERRRRLEAPPLADLAHHVAQLTPRLWEREPGESDFLHLRIGIADQPSRTRVTLKDGGSRKLRPEMHALAAEFALARQVPVLAELDRGGVGVAGPDRVGAARALVAQVAALHSPDDLIVCAALGDEAAAAWTWLGWLPHVRQSDLGVTPLVTDRAGVSRLIEILRARADGTPNRRLLLVVDDTAPIDRSRIVPFLERAAASAVSFVWMSETTSTLPRPCATVIDTTEGGIEVAFTDRGELATGLEIEVLDDATCDDMGRDLAPVIDAGQAETAAGRLPRVVTIPSITSPAVVSDDLAILERWRDSAAGARTSTSLAAVVGMQADAPFSIDIRQDGPHALVAGTTGAGKSEFLQAWVASLAVTHPPSRVNFLFVDYKGGAAFKDCIDLPHAVGLVTDLDTHHVRRALTSLEAELTIREHLLNRAGAKDLIEMEQQGHPDAPPNLLIVVDEFAALAREVPEFVDGVVNVAQRGRSLGLHLVLATQRPAGVITNNIRANTNLRVALRMADTDESTDVIGSPMAADIERSTPGRAVARIGPNELVAFQSAYAGARGEGRVSRSVELTTLGFDDPEPLGRTDDRSEGEIDHTAPSHLAQITQTVMAAHARSRRPAPRRPWLDPLPERIDFDELPTAGSPEEVYLGVKDEPEHQRYAWVSLAPEKEGSYLVVGTGGSGKTGVLRSIAYGLSAASRPETAEIHGLDFAGRGLSMIEILPTVGAVVSGSDTELVTRLLGRLRRVVDERTELLGEQRAASLSEYRQRTGKSMRRVFVLLDGLSTFLEEFERVDRGRWVDLLPVLLASGRQVGVHFVMTAGRRGGLPMSLVSNVWRTFVLRLANADDYDYLGCPKDVLTAASPPGRAVDGGYEMQFAVPAGVTDGRRQEQAFQRLAARLLSEGIEQVPGVARFPVRVGLGEVVGAGAIGIGVGGPELNPLTLSADTRLLAVLGPSASGKTTTLATLAVSIRAAGIQTRLVLVAATGAAPAHPELWDQVVAGTEQGAGAVTEASTRVKQGEHVTLMVDDGVDAMEGSFAVAMDELVRSLRTKKGMVVISGDPSRARRLYSDTWNEVKAGKTGILLHPDFDYDGEILGTALTRPAGIGFPPGRGFLVVRGSATLAQLAMHDGVRV
jgi:S-DNA-T family DNA segregation ATPase FtsK/SpoIIIE